MLQNKNITSATLIIMKALTIITAVCF